MNVLQRLNSRLSALPKVISSLLALFGVLTATAINLLPSGQPQNPSDSLFATSGRPAAGWIPTVSAGIFDALHITYSTEVSQTGFGEVSVRLKLFPVLPNVGLPAIELSGPGIEVAPAARKEFVASELLGNVDGAIWTWTFRAKEPGENQLSLVIINLPRKLWIISEGKAVDFVSPIRLPVYVRSVSGLSPRVEHYIKIIGTTLAFVLAYPLVLAVFRRRLGVVDEDAPESRKRTKAPGTSSQTSPTQDGARQHPRNVDEA